MGLDDDWEAKAACKDEDPEVFFPTTVQGKKVDATQAKAVCESCSVRMTCLAFSLFHSIPYGVWGGFTAEERKRISKATKAKFRQAWRMRYPYARPRRFVIPRGRRKA